MKLVTLEDCLDFIVISDLHLCNKLDRMDLVYKTYEYAYQNDIHTILNLGDLIDSVMPHNKKQLKIGNISQQIRYVIENYPFIKEISTYILYGNHDYYPFINQGFDVANLISKEREDFINLGYGEAFLNIHDNYIKLRHKIAYLKNYKQNIHTYLTLIGHLHKYKIKVSNELAICVPSLSNLSSTPKEKNCPNFLRIKLDFYEDILSSVHIENIDIENNLCTSELDIGMNISKKQHTKIKEFFSK